MVQSHGQVLQTQEPDVRGWEEGPQAWRQQAMPQQGKQGRKYTSKFGGKKAGVDIAHTRQKAGVGPVAAVSALSTNLSI